MITSWWQAAAPRKGAYQVQFLALLLIGTDAKTITNILISNGIGVVELLYTPLGEGVSPLLNNLL
jgi:hypothetical protein